MDYNRIRNAILAVFAAILFAVVCHIAGRVQGRRIGREQGYDQGFAEGYAAPHPSDTIWTRDTLVIDRPVVVERWKDKPVLVPVTDTLRVTDTLYMAVQTEVKRYGGQEGDEYEAQVSGWNPSLDWVKVYPATQTITQYVVKEAPRWSLGVTAGPAAVWNGKAVTGGIGVAAGLTFRIGK